MKFVFLYIFMTILFSNSLCAKISPEILYIDQSDDMSLDDEGNPIRTFLISNSVHDSGIRI